MPRLEAQSGVSPSVRILLGLISGVTLGFIIRASHSPWLAEITVLTGPLGTLFINSIRACVIPLVTASLIVGFASSGNLQKIGRFAFIATALMLLMLTLASAFAGLVALPLFHQIPMIEARARTSQTAKPPQSNGNPADVEAPSILRSLPKIVPANIIKAASEEGLLPIVVVCIAFGLALTQVEEQSRRAVISFFGGVSSAFSIMIAYVVRAAPYGVFCLAMGLAAHTGLRAAGALAYYVAVLSAISIAFVLVVLYPLVGLVSRITLGRFARAIAPAQVLALITRSSLAALPAAYDAATKGIDLPEELCDFFLPFAASTFRVGGCMAQVVGAIFLARFYGVPIAMRELASISISAVAISLTVPGVPGGAILVMAPLLASSGIPAEGMGILLAVDTVPDMFRTMANVTGWLCVASLLPSVTSDQERATDAPLCADDSAVG